MNDITDRNAGYDGRKLGEAKFGVLPTVVSPEFIWRLFSTLFGVSCAERKALTWMIALASLSESARNIALGGLDKAAKLFEQAYPSVKVHVNNVGRRSGRVPETADCN